MKDVFNTKKIMVVWLILALASFVIFGFLFWNIKDKNQQISTLVNQADQSAAKDQELRAIKTSLSDNKDAIAQLDSYFIPADGVVSFITMLEDLGRQSGVTLTINSVATDTDPTVLVDFKEILHLKIQTTGSWANTFYFLSVLDNLPYRINVGQVSLGLAGGSDAILFSSASTTEATARIPGADEKWQGQYDVTVLKLK